MTKKSMNSLFAIASFLTASTAHAQTAPPAPGSSQAPPNTAPSSEPAPPPVPPSPSPQPAQTQSKEVTPVPVAKSDGDAVALPDPWFARPPLTVSVGEGAKKWDVTVFGLIGVDALNDSTRSYGESIGGSVVARPEIYEGKQGQTIFSIRNSRFGFALRAPVIGGIRPSAVIDGGFTGNQPDGPPSTCTACIGSAAPTTISESAYFGKGTFGVRNAYLKLDNDYVDVLVGQAYYLFGWQNYYSPCTIEYFGLPNQPAGRAAQVRLAHAFESDAVTVDLAVAGLRPAQRDSQIPDANAGVRLSFNHWKGVRTPGNGGTTVAPLSLGVSATVREFKVDAFTPPPAQASNNATGWGVAIGALIPVIPAKDSNERGEDPLRRSASPIAEDRGNKLTLSGAFVIGSGISDLVNANGNASFPTLPNPAMISPPPFYTPDIDNGLVSFDTAGVLHTIDWQTFMVGIQYYLPPTGRVIVSANYTEGYSKNMADLFPRGGAEIMLFSRVAKRTRYADVNAMFDVTPAVRIGASFGYTASEYIDGVTPHNLRWTAQALYAF